MLLMRRNLITTPNTKCFTTTMVHSISSVGLCEVLPHSPHRLEIFALAVQHSNIRPTLAVLASRPTQNRQLMLRSHPLDNNGNIMCCRICVSWYISKRSARIVIFILISLNRKLLSTHIMNLGQQHLHYLMSRHTPCIT